MNFKRKRTVLLQNGDTVRNQVKHLLIILISFLLLSSFVTSCDKKEETLYRWETSSGIVWKRFGDKDTHRVYKGEWKNGEKWRPNGLGVMTYPDGHKYVGEYKDGLENGQGTYTWSDGRKYVGEFKDGKQNGQGTYIYHDGRKYEGEWKVGREWNGTGYNKNGEIVVRFVNGKQIEQ